MYQVIKSFIILLLIWTPTRCLQAANFCYQVHRTNKISLKAPRVEESEKIALQSHFEAATEKVRSFTTQQSQLLFPSEEIIILVHPFLNYEGSRAEILRRRDALHITVPYQWLVEVKVQEKNNQSQWKTFLNSPEEAVALYYHELGHAISRLNLEVKNSQIGIFIRDEAAFDSVTRKSKDRLDLFNSETNPELKEKLKEELILLYREFDALDKKMDSNPEKQRVFVGMDELFADLTAVLVSRKPTAMSDSVTVGTLYGLKTPGDAHYRDFSNDQNEIKVWVPTWDKHDMFAPTRFYLFQNFLRNPIYLSGHKAGWLHRMVLEGISSASNDPRLDRKDLSPTEANTVLIEHLNKILK